MGKTTGFLEYTREASPAPALGRAHQRLVRSLPGVRRRESPHARRALHGLRRALLPHRLPAQQRDSGLERSGVSRPLARRHPRAALDQQFPRVHRPHLPGAVRSRLRAGHQRAAGDHQGDREDHHRACLSRRLDPPRAAADSHRQARGGGRFRTGRARRRAATQSRRPFGDGLRKSRPHRRPAALRHPRVQDGEAGARPAARSDDRRGRRVQDQRRRRPHDHRPGAAREFRRDPAGRRRRESARSSRCRAGN